MTSEVRSRTMRAVKSKNTAPELTVRKLVHRLGYRYRLHIKNIAGTPDLVFVRLRKVILVHGCFWHGHDCKRGARIPKENSDYWQKKIERNLRRDATNLGQLRESGWGALIVWECELKDVPALREKIDIFLKSCQA